MASGGLGRPSRERTKTKAGAVAATSYIQQHGLLLQGPKTTEERKTKHSYNLEEIDDGPR